MDKLHPQTHTIAVEVLRSLGTVTPRQDQKQRDEKKVRKKIKVDGGVPVPVFLCACVQAFFFSCCRQ
jgi:hypothetical protein